MTVPLVVSIISVTFSGLAILLAWIAHWRISSIQKRQLEIEEARENDRIRNSNKAQLRAYIKKEVESQRMHHTVWKHLLRIENMGLAEAREIKVILDDKPLFEHPTILKGQRKITQIGPQSHFDYTLALTMGAPIPSRVQITWSDDSGEPGDYKTSLNY